MKKIINLYKKVGETPLETIEKFKQKNKSYSNKTTGYAGRLDPMAEGLLLILVGEENKKIREYLKFDKTYVAEILIGFSSDSNDVLGISKKDSLKEIEEKEIKKTLKSFTGDYNQKIPEYSSYKVKGKPMFHYARKGIKIESIKKNVIIKKIKIDSIYKISSSRLLKYITNKIEKVKGDFRQKESIKNWEKLLKEENKFQVIKAEINCSSGTYIRAIADDLGKKLNSSALLLSLKRTKVGKFNVKESIKI